MLKRFNIFKRQNEAERQYQLIAHKNPKSAMTEAYRTMRTNLDFAGVDNPCRSILFSSSNPQDGKSTTVANLAVVMAQAGHKVILVDCDLRKPVQHKIFEISNQKGVTNCLLGQMQVEQAAHTGMIENLTILTSGPIPPNPAEILNSAKTRAFWGMLLEKYDYILIDAPPVLAVADAAIISTQIDGVVIVIRSAVTKIDLARQAKEQFNKANARIIGVVLNQVKMNSDGYQYYYYYSSNED